MHTTRASVGSPASVLVTNWRERPVFVTEQYCAREITTWIRDSVQRCPSWSMWGTICIFTPSLGIHGCSSYPICLSLRWAAVFIDLGIIRWGGSWLGVRTTGRLFWLVSQLCCMLLKPEWAQLPLKLRPDRRPRASPSCRGSRVFTGCGPSLCGCQTWVPFYRDHFWNVPWITVLSL